MQLDEELGLVSEALVPHEPSRFRQHLDPVWIEEALLATETATIIRVALLLSSTPPLRQARFPRACSTCAAISSCYSCPRPAPSASTRAL